MLLKNIARQTILPSIFILTAVIHAGCSSRFRRTLRRRCYSPKPAVAATPLPTPNPDQAAGLITRFYRDIDTDTKESVRDLFTLVTPDFVRNHHDDLIADYSFINDPKVEIQSIHGRTVSYTLDYVYLAKAGRLYWERTGSLGLQSWCRERMGTRQRYLGLVAPCWHLAARPCRYGRRTRYGLQRWPSRVHLRRPTVLVLGQG